MHRPFSRRRIVKYAAATAFVAICGLFLYILWVTAPNHEHHVAWQLGRFDFPTDLNEADRQHAKTVLAGIDGIIRTDWNRDSTSLIYSFQPGTTTLASITSGFDDAYEGEATPFIPDAMEISKGCPVTGRNSVAGRVVIFFRNVF